MSSKNDNLLKLYNFSLKKWHFLEAANVTFWDSDNIIVKNYKNLKETLSKESLNELNYILDESYKTLLNSNKKAEYFRYLMIEYTLGQPNDIEQLINEYYSLIFPYYLFPLKNDSSNELFYWGLGMGDWELRFGDWAQSPIPNSQSPIPNPQTPNPQSQTPKPQNKKK